MKDKKAFTLAETLIVLVILGVIASITIPALVNRHVEAERRTKLRKAMSVYDAALNKMVIENGIKSDTALINWADSDTKNDCANTSAYFKVSRNLEVNGNTTNCKFRAPDGVFWDISDIQKPLIALREEDLNDETAQSETNRAFYMFGWFDEQGSLRSNDMGKIDATNKADLEKLYDFIAGKSTTSLGEIGTTSEPEPEPVVENPPKYDNILAFANGDWDHVCSGQNIGCYVRDSGKFIYYDNAGNEFVRCVRGPGVCDMGANIEIDENTTINIDSMGNSCNISRTTNGAETCIKYGFTECDQYHCTRQ